MSWRLAAAPPLSRGSRWKGPLRLPEESGNRASRRRHPGSAHVLAAAQVSLCRKRQLLAAQSELATPPPPESPPRPGHGLAGSPRLLPAPRPGAASPKVKDKDIFRRATKKQFGSFSGSARACNSPQGPTGRYSQPIKLT